MAVAHSTKARRRETHQERATIDEALAILKRRLRHPGQAITCPEDAATLARLHIGAEEREVFVCLFLDNKHRLIAPETLSLGTINTATVHPREVARAALRHNAAAMLLAHNHPSGDPQPSRADEWITAKIRDVLELIEVRLLDHLVLGEEGFVSMKRLGLEPWRPDPEDARRTARHAFMGRLIALLIARGHREHQHQVQYLVEMGVCGKETAEHYLSGRSMPTQRKQRERVCAALGLAEAELFGCREV
ncbi:JAB domain-containing protein [Thioalkalivibrio sulfidiphilus]|uniref:JAB domain-containing protein n=1 Tax=Thioalkalivibrio sulfidiphilus TaxID=1033854 RepID=UPI000369C90D|nr:DNA repair protein RadC [Thioalkalivibrio sulfidiphilus]